MQGDVTSIPDPSGLSGNLLLSTLTLTNVVAPIATMQRMPRSADSPARTRTGAEARILVKLMASVVREAIPLPRKKAGHHALQAQRDEWGVRCRDGGALRARPNKKQSYLTVGRVSICVNNR